jgi:hypothetical protein
LENQEPGWFGEESRIIDHSDYVDDDDDVSKSEARKGDVRLVSNETME